MLTVPETLHKRLGNLKVNQLMNYNSKRLCIILCGKHVGYLRAMTQLIIGEHVQLLCYESFCLITVSYLTFRFRFMGWSGSFHTSSQYDIHPYRTFMFQPHLLHRESISAVISVFQIFYIVFVWLTATSFHSVHQQSEKQLTETLAWDSNPPH